MGMAMGNYFTYKFISEYGLESTDFRGRVLEYLGQKIHPGHREESTFPLLMEEELTSYSSAQSEEAAKNGDMTEWIGMDSYHREQ